VIITKNSQVARGIISGHHPPSGKHPNIIGGSVNGTGLAKGGVHAHNLGAITRVTQTITIPNHSQDEAAAFCPKGARMISGGARPEVFGMPLNASFPNKAPRAGSRRPGTTPAYPLISRPTCSA
jgi:hypothetical protein